jgi:hypothetical protein
MKEIIFGDKNQYKALENGDIYGCSVRGSHAGKKGEWRKINPTVSRNGYLYFRLNGRRGVNVYVHRIIAELFLGLPESKMDVNHINCIKHDNRIENLEWMTRKQNIIHARDNGLMKPNRHLTDEQVFMVKRLLKEGVRPMDIHRMTKIPNPTIYKIRNGKNYVSTNEAA